MKNFVNFLSKFMKNFLETSQDSVLNFGTKAEAFTTKNGERNFCTCPLLTYIKKYLLIKLKIKIVRDKTEDKCDLVLNKDGKDI